MKRHLICIVVAAACLAAAAPASAQVMVDGTGEPAYTNSTQNTQHFRYSQPSGTEAYRLRFSYYANNALVHETTVSVSGTGSIWANWAGVAALQHGGQYGICVQGQYRFPNDSLWISDGPNSCSMATMEGKRSSTTIDRSKPTLSLSAAGGAEATKNASIPVSMAFGDDVAGPFPANFVCVEAGTGPCQGVYGHSPQCSQPANSSRNTTFGCAIDASALPDGPVTICAKAADSSVPDNPNSANQAGQAGNANISDAACDTVVLDRGAPSVSVSTSSTTVQAGDAVTLAAEVADPVSGVDGGSVRFEWSDGHAMSTGATATRTFTQPGTYVVTVRAADKAGNEASAQKTITVSAPAAGDGGPGTGTPGTGTPGTGTPGTPGSVAGGIRIGRLSIVVPKRVRLGRTRQLLLGTSTDQAGTLSLRLTRGRKTFSRVTIGLAPGATKQRLRLPRRLKAGTYTVKIAFRADGAGRAAAGSARVAIKR